MFDCANLWLWQGEMGSTDRWSGTERTLGACCSALSKRHPDCLVAKSFNDVKVSVTGVLAPGHMARWVLPSWIPRVPQRALFLWGGLERSQVSANPLSMHTDSAGLRTVPVQGDPPCWQGAAAQPSSRCEGRSERVCQSHCPRSANGAVSPIAGHCSAFRGWR